MKNKADQSRDALKRNAQHYNALHQNGAGFHSDKRDRRESGRNHTRELFEDYRVACEINEEVSHLED